jgi:hypothetical protein
MRQPQVIGSVPMMCGVEISFAGASDSKRHPGESVASRGAQVVLRIIEEWKRREEDLSLVSLVKTSLPL